MPKTCEECFHYEACKEMYEAVLSQDWYPFAICPSFKDRSRIVELPCNEGDTVYCLQPCVKRYAKSYREFVESFNFIYEMGVVERIATKEMIGYLIGYPHFSSYVLGENVFLTKEEAEAALAKMKV